MVKTQKQAIEEILVNSGLKRTKARMDVLSVLMAADGLLSIDAIQGRLQSEVHLVTLYRMLRQFVDKGIVYQADLRQGKAFYELQTAHHHHITCTACGIQEEVKTCIVKLQERVQKESKSFKNISTHSLEFFGMCDKCTNK